MRAVSSFLKAILVCHYYRSFIPKMKVSDKPVCHLYHGKIHEKKKATYLPMNKQVMKQTQKRNLKADILGLSFS